MTERRRVVPGGGGGRGVPLPRRRVRGAELEVARGVPARVGRQAGRAHTLRGLQPRAAGALPARARRGLLRLLLDAQPLQRYRYYRYVGCVKQVLQSILEIILNTSLGKQRLQFDIRLFNRICSFNVTLSFKILYKICKYSDKISVFGC